MIYTIPEEEEPISNCTSESESIFNPDSNSDNDNDENNGSSSTQNGNENISDSDFNLNPKIYIVLPDLSKEQELKWYSDNNKDIMPERTHDTDTRFDLRYLGKEAIKLEPNLHTCIDLKIALEIPATTIVQLAFRSSLVKKGINIRGEIINTRSVIEIPKETIIRYLITKVKDQPPNHIPDFLQLCKYVDITLQTIYRRSECYLLQPEQLEQINMGNLDPFQWMQLKMLLNNFNDIFTSKNEFGQTNIIQH
ncbi:hypothetical protein G9A89_008197 [Geosiphon pyriformis]|nr:hypothetical protein G9A89_008197 [Geosiphon pyriformis]